MAGVRTILSSFFILGSVALFCCFASESPILVGPTPGSLEHALRGLDPLHNCTVQLYLLSGVHVISSGVAVSAASVAISSHANNTDRPVVRCGDNMSHPGDYVNETEVVGFLTFWKGARDVSISGVDFEDCPRTVQFIEVDRVSISDCTFRLATQCARVRMRKYTIVHRYVGSLSKTDSMNISNSFPVSYCLCMLCLCMYIVFIYFCIRTRVWRTL